MQRRSLVRFPEVGTVVVKVLGSTQPLIYGSIANLSEAGLMLTVDEPLGVGDTVTVDGGDDLLVGEVRHCDRFCEGYLTSFSINDWVDKGKLQASINQFVMSCA